MRGSDEQTGTLFSYVDVEDRVPADHPLRAIRTIVNEVLEGLNGEFARIYSDKGRPSSRRSGCCGPCCCRRSIRSGRKVS